MSLSPSKEQNNEGNEFLSKKHKNDDSIALCQSCKINQVKYTCPRCFYKTCSVSCVKAHKKKFNCNGQRDKFKKVSSQADYNEKVFYRDINFLNLTINEINTSNRKVFAISEDIDKSQNKINKNFKRICKKFRNVIYYKSPLIMSCCQENKTYPESSTKKIFWTVKFNFVTQNLCHLFSKIQFDDETYTLYSIGEYLFVNKNEINQPELLKYINKKEWILNYKVCMRIKKEMIKDFTNVFCHQNYYYEKEDINIPLKNVLDGKEVYEYPQFYLFQNE